MAFTNPYEKSMSMATFAGGLSDLLNQFLMYKMIQQMYPRKKGEQKQEIPTELPPPRLGGQFDIGSQVPGLAPAQMQQGPDIMQILQLLQMLGGDYGSQGI